MQNVDLAIVGGGPAGLATAIHAARAGVNSIILFESKTSWGRPVQCAEFVPVPLTQIFDLPAEVIATRISRLSLYLDGKLLRSIDAPGFVVHRDALERYLAGQALLLGVRCGLGSRVERVEGNVLHVDGKTIAARIIVGADGPRSLVRRVMGLPPNLCAVGLQYSLPTAGMETGDAEIHFSPRYGAGYAWYFPKGESANVGLAVDVERRARLTPMLDALVAQLVGERRLTGGVVLRSTGGPIPVGGPAPETHRDTVLLVGDAAGQTNPLTGGGVYNAAACGKIAGEVIAEAITNNDLSRLSDYESAWREVFESALRRSLQLRRLLMSASAREYESKLRKAWKI